MMPDDKQKQNLIQRITNLFKAVVEPNFPITTEREPPISYIDSNLFDLSPARFQKYKDYEEMDTEVVELSSALDLYADFITSSQMGGSSGDSYNLEIQEEGEFDKETDACVDLEERLDLKENVWFMTRNVVKYGDAFYEVVATPDMIVKLKYLPEETMFVNFKEGTTMKDPEIPYYQRDKDTLRKVAEFAPWEVIHFKIGPGDYGVDFSVLAAARRLYRLLRMLEDTLLVTRIARSNQRAVYKIDVSGMSEQEVVEYIRKLKLLNKRKTFFSQAGKMRQEMDPLQPQEDVYVPVRKGGIGGDYQVISGETHLGEIRDIWYFHSKLFAATKVPKAYLGFEADVNAKATLIQQHVAFVKAVKRFRYVTALGIKKLYRMNFLMNGIDPSSFQWGIKFPNIGSPDEQVAWEIERIKAEVVKAYGDVGVMLPREWIVKKLFMNLSSEEAEELLDQLEKQDDELAASGANGPENPPGEPGLGADGLPLPGQAAVPGAGEIPPSMMGKPPGWKTQKGPGGFGGMSKADIMNMMRMAKMKGGKSGESAVKDLLRQLENNPKIRKMAEEVTSLYKQSRQGRNRFEIY